MVLENLYVINSVFLLEGSHQQQGMPGPGPRHIVPTAGGRPPLPVAAPRADEGPQKDPPKPKVPVLEKYLVNQLSTEEQNALNSKLQEVTEADKKVFHSFLFLLFCLWAMYLLFLRVL